MSRDLSVEATRLDAFYRDVQHALGLHAQRRGSTAEGAAVVVKRIAREHGVTVVDVVPLPRLTRSEREGFRG